MMPFAARADNINNHGVIRVYVVNSVALYRRFSVFLQFFAYRVKLRIRKIAVKILTFYFVEQKFTEAFRRNMLIISDFHAFEQQTCIFFCIVVAAA